jgi:hypothetical protein
VDNRHLPYLNAILAADIKGKAKFTLTFLIDTMDFDTRETYIGQTALAEKMGVSYDSAAAGLDLLEDLKLIKTVGIQPTHPGSMKATTRYRILLEPLPEITDQLTLGKLPMNGDSTVGKKPTVGKRPSNHIQSVVTPNGRGVSEASNAVEKTHTHTDAVSARPEQTEPDQTPRPRVSDEEIRTLVSIFFNLTEVEATGSDVAEGSVKDAWDELRSYDGPLSSARLALLMFYAFHISNFWSKPKNWHSLDMENFLNASRKLDKEFPKWRQHDKIAKMFPTAQSVLDKICPPPPAPEPRYEDGHTFADDSFTAVCRTCGVTYMDYIGVWPNPSKPCPKPSQVALSE